MVVGSHAVQADAPHRAHAERPQLDGLAHARSEFGGLLGPHGFELDELDCVPAAVLCARCGSPECTGCELEERSGVVAIVPWERAGAFWPRILGTTELTTHEGEAFFGALPDGPIGPALQFGVACELLATSALVVVWGAFAVLFAIATDRFALAGLVRWGTLSLMVPPLLSFWMVLGHAAHGLALGFGAERAGARAQRTRALRMGLYACGWDLGSGPTGIAIDAYRAMRGDTGGKRLRERLGASWRIGAASRAFVVGAFGLDAKGAAQALRWGFASAVVSTLVSAFAIAVGVFLWWWF